MIRPAFWRDFFARLGNTGQQIAQSPPGQEIGGAVDPLDPLNLGAEPIRYAPEGPRVAGAWSPHQPPRRVRLCAEDLAGSC